MPTSRVLAAPPPDGYDGAAASSAGAELNAGELPEAVPLHGEQQQQHQQPAPGALLLVGGSR